MDRQRYDGAPENTVAGMQINPGVNVDQKILRDGTKPNANATADPADNGGFLGKVAGFLSR